MAAKQATEKPAERLWTGTFLLVLLFTLFQNSAGQMTVPLVAKYALSLGADLTLASTIAGIMSLVSLVVCPFAGALADRVNRKKILLAAGLGYAICLALHAVCTTTGMLIVMRMATGIFFSICSVTNIAFSSSFIPKQRMGEGLGYVALASIVAQAAGPSIGLSLVNISGYWMTFLMAGVSVFLCVLVIVFLPYKDVKKPASEQKKVTFADIYAKEFTLFMLLAFLFSSGNGLVSTYLAIIADERSIAGISLFFTVYSIFMLLIRPLTGKLMDKKGVYFVLVPAVVFAALGMVLIGVGMSLGVLLIASVCKAFGQGNGTPTMQAHCVKKLDKSRAGVATSTIMIGQNVGNALAPIMGSYFVGGFGYKGMFCGAGLVILVGGMILVGIQYLKEKKEAAV